MSTHRVEAKLSQDGELVLKDLPFRAGDVVDVLIVENKTDLNGDARSLIMFQSKTKIDNSNGKPLLGSVIKYESPTEPVGIEDWDEHK